jgi:sugar-specific transcriptional regulator TrmB
MLEQLQKLGLTSKEASLYLVALEIGEASPVSTLANKAGINRTTAYDILENLVKRGLILASDHKNFRTYRAQPPSKLVTHLKEEGNRFIRLSQEAEKILPELTTHYHALSDRPRVYFYEGEEGLVRVYEETLTSREEIRAFANAEVNQDYLSWYFPRYYERRAAKGIPIRGLLMDTPVDRHLHEIDEQHLRTSRILPKSKLNFTPEVNFFDNKIMIADWKEKLGIIIESQEITHLFKQVFELAWEAAEKYQTDEPVKKGKKKDKRSL